MRRDRQLIELTAGDAGLGGRLVQRRLDAFSPSDISPATAAGRDKARRRRPADGSRPTDRRCRGARCACPSRESLVEATSARGASGSVRRQSGCPVGRDVTTAAQDCRSVLAPASDIEDRGRKAIRCPGRPPVSGARPSATCPMAHFARARSAAMQRLPRRMEFRRNLCSLSASAPRAPQGTRNPRTPEADRHHFGHRSGWRLWRDLVAAGTAPLGPVIR